MSGITLFGDWDRYLQMLDGADFQRRLARNMRIANMRIGLLMAGHIRRAIRDDKYAPNSAFTVAMKGSSKPLVNVGDLFRFVNYDVEPNGMGVMVGVRRDAPPKAGKPIVSIARALHEGFAIQVTPKVRRAIWAKLRRDGRDKAFTPAVGGGGKSVYVIPPRPFITEPVTEHEAEALALWREAYLRSLREV